MFEGADLRRAAVFHAVARHGGIAAASRAMGKSGPAIHADLRQFERDVGASLMQRVGRNLRLTSCGRALFDVIGRSLDEIERVRQYLHRGEASATPIRVGAVTGFGRYRLTPHLFDMAGERPVLFRVGSHDETLARLISGDVDLAITYRPVSAVPVETEQVAVEELVLVGPTEREFSFGDVEELRFVTYDEYDFVFARWFDTVFGRQPRALRRADHFTELEEALASVKAGRGATIAPLDACLALGLKPVSAQTALNDLYLCGIAGATSSPEAVELRLRLA